MDKRKAKIGLILVMWLVIGIGSSFLFLVMARSNAANLGFPFGDREEEAVTQITDTAPPSDIGPVSGPSTLKIPKLNIDANIQHVGLTAKGNMGVPTGKNKWIDVAWYKLGPKPGEVGNAAISGHVDNALGMNAIFSNLDQLNTGDEIIIRDTSGKDIKFRVTHIGTYDYKNAPLNEIFGTTEKRRLNLITCTGDWIQSEKTYSHRLVVYAEAVN